MVEILIIGQGVSGTLLSWFLHQRKLSFHVIDSNDAHSASRVAAGLINPLTGRRLVKSWNIDTLYPFARKTYRALSDYLGISVVQDLQVLKLFPSEEMKAFWESKAQEESLRSYFESNVAFQAGAVAALQRALHPHHGTMVYGPAMQINLPELTAKWRSYLTKAGLISSADFDYNQLSRQADGSYKYLPGGKGEIIHAQKVVFCEGARMAANPWFREVPIRGNLGERLLVEIDLPRGYIYRHKGLGVRLTSGPVWIGSTNNWDIDTGVVPPPPATSDKGHEQLVAQLQSLSPLPYKIIDHSAAYRPTIKDRRPAVGGHPTHPNLYLLNGMGTKGASLAPFYADRLAQQLKADLQADANAPDKEKALFIPEAVDVKRFFKVF